MAFQNGENPHPDQTGLLVAYRQISTLPLDLRQQAVAILKCPELLANPLWIRTMTARPPPPPPGAPLLHDGNTGTFAPSTTTAYSTAPPLPQPSGSYAPLTPSAPSLLPPPAVPAPAPALVPVGSSAAAPAVRPELVTLLQLLASGQLNAAQQQLVAQLITQPYGSLPRYVGCTCY